MFAMAFAAAEEEEEEEEEGEGEKASQLLKTRFQLVRMSWRERARGVTVAMLVSSGEEWPWMLGWRPLLLGDWFVVADDVRLTF